MLSPTQLRKETLIELNSKPYKVIEYSQKQLGRGGSIVNTKLKNMITGQVIDKTFRNDEKVKPAELNYAKVQYLYSSGSKFSVMDQTNFETIEIESKLDPKIPQYLTEGSVIDVIKFGDQIIGFDWPKNVVLRVVSAPGSDKGNTSGSATKEIELETGLKIQAPLFIKENDKVRVDTRSGDYLERIQ